MIAAIRSNRSADAAREAGADVVFSTNERALVETVHELTEGLGADVVLDFVGQRETLQASIGALAPAGRLVIMGYFPKGGVLEIPTWVFTEERTITGNRSAGRQDVADSVALIHQHRIKPIVTKVFPLKDAALAHRAFEAREIVGRAVLVV